MLMEDIERRVASRALLASGQAKQLRVEARLTIQEVADFAGVNRNAVYLWENGLRQPKGEPAARYFSLLEWLCASAQTSASQA